MTQPHLRVNKVQIKILGPTVLGHHVAATAAKITRD